jgi:hypothetical protein
MKTLHKTLTAALLVLTSVIANAQMSKVQTVWVVLMENHNWTGNWAGSPAAISNDEDPDLKHNPLAPFINGQLLQVSVSSPGPDGNSFPHSLHLNLSQSDRSRSAALCSNPQCGTGSGCCSGICGSFTKEIQVEILVSAAAHPA